MAGGDVTPPVAFTGGVAMVAGMEKALNPDVSPRMRGVVEKCNFCHGRWHAARRQAVADGKSDMEPVAYVPACAEACPTKAITFGDLNDAASPVAVAAKDCNSFRLLETIEHGEKVLEEPAQRWKGGPPWLNCALLLTAP